MLRNIKTDQALDGVKGVASGFGGYLGTGAMMGLIPDQHKKTASIAAALAGTVAVVAIGTGSKNATQLALALGVATRSLGELSRAYAKSKNLANGSTKTKKVLASALGLACPCPQSGINAPLVYDYASLNSGVASYEPQAQALLDGVDMYQDESSTTNSFA